jgi:hypothetical protein
MVKELITRADAIIAEVRGETGGGSNAKISKSKNNLATFLKLHKGEHEKTSAQLDAILGVLKKDNKLEKKEADADRKERQRQKREKREKLIESLKSGVGSAASAGKKVVSTLVAPFRDVWEKIADFLKFTVIGTLFNGALNWFGEDKNIDKIKRIGRFLNFWWPSLLAGFALFFTPIGSFVAGAVGILTTTLPLLVGLIAKYPILAAALAAGGLAAYFGSKSKGEGSVDNNSANQFDINQTESGGNTGKFNPIEETSKNKTEAMKNLENASDGGTFRAPMFNQGGTVAGSGNEDSVPAMLTPGEVVIPASTGNISKTPIMVPKVKGGSGGNITPPSTIKITNSVVLPSIRKEKPNKSVREGSTIPTFQISSNANSRQYTLMGMGLEGMV